MKPFSNLAQSAVILVVSLSLVMPASAQEKAAKPRIEKPVAIINELLESQWKDNFLTPANKTSDLEFLRRVSVHIIGRIPTLDEIDTFEKDNSADKRGRCVDRLLASDEYAENFARLWTRWLFAGSVYPPAYREQTQRWLKKQIAANISYTELATRLLTATGKSNENPAVHFILAHLGEPVPAEKQREEGQFDMTPMAPRAARVFLGYQIQCTQCHCHPFNADWRQHHFWGMNAFWRQVERIGTPADQFTLATLGCTPAGTVMKGSLAVDIPQAAKLPMLELRDNPDFNLKGIVYYEQRTGVIHATRPIFLDGRKIRPNHAGTRREEFARLLISNSNFGKAFVSRMWGVFFSRSLNCRPQVDDFGEHNELIHPELLDQLAKATEAGGYDIKRLIRWICASDAYQLKSTFNATNDQDEAEVYFSRMPLRQMGFDQMFESVWTATRMADAIGQGEKKKLREQWRKFLHLEFDDDESFYLPAGDSWLQMMLLMNNQAIHDRIGDRDAGTLRQALKRQRHADVAETLYLATLTRRPTAAELAIIEREIRQERARFENADLRPVWQDLFWALLNSNEFSVNH
jgi:hypothetical protein